MLARSIILSKVRACNLSQQPVQAVNIRLPDGEPATLYCSFSTEANRRDRHVVDPNASDNDDTRAGCTESKGFVA